MSLKQRIFKTDYTFAKQLEPFSGILIYLIEHPDYRDKRLTEQVELLREKAVQKHYDISKLEYTLKVDVYPSGAIFLTMTAVETDTSTRNIFTADEEILLDTKLVYYSKIKGFFFLRCGYKKETQLVVDKHANYYDARLQDQKKIYALAKESKDRAIAASNDALKYELLYRMV